jgi:hypothetical protein
MVAMKSRRIQAAVELRRRGIFTELADELRHDGCGSLFL